MFVLSFLFFYFTRKMTFEAIFIHVVVLSLYIATDVVFCDDQASTTDPLNVRNFANTLTRNSASEIDFIRIPQPPVFLRQNFPLTIEYRCVHPAVVGVTVRVWTESRDGAAVFRHRFNCSADGKVVRQSVVRLRLPRYVAYRPSRDNRYSLFTDRAVIQVWMLDRIFWEMRKRANQRPDTDWYAHSQTRDEISVRVALPFDRDVRPSERSPTWWRSIRDCCFPLKAQCAEEKEVIRMVSFPVALSSSMTGVHRVIPEYKNHILRDLRRKALVQPEFTFVMWLYIIDYCEISEQCSLYHHMTWDDRIAMPMIYINRKGHIRIEFITINGFTVSFTTPPDFLIPKEEWFRLTISCHTNKMCFIHTNYGPNFEHEGKYEMPLHDYTLYFDDTLGIHVFGGSEMLPSFKGYIGEATYYRRRALVPRQIPFPSRDHPMFVLELDERNKRCVKYLREVDFVLYSFRLLLKEIVERKSCKTFTFESVFSKSPPTSSSSVCKPFNIPLKRRHLLMTDFVRRHVINGERFELVDVGNEIYDNATDFLNKNDVSDVRKAIPLLKESSCFGNDDATFLLTVIYNYGLLTTVDEQKSHAYLMLGAVNGHRLSSLSLASKHTHGLDGIPADVEQAYVYYKRVSDTTVSDLNQHYERGIATEMVRLTDEAAIKAQTEENDDIFYWLKHQASRGVHSAQQNMARLLYWGSHGVKRDVSSAADYYQMSAQTGDATALYDFGIILLKGHGTQKNMTRAMEFLEQAAEQNHAPALNTIGWYALEIEKNYTKAAAYLERAFRLGSMDAGHNLAHMCLSGLYPGVVGVNREKAWEYLSKAASKGQINSAQVVAMYNMRGHSLFPRSPETALEWARYVAEQNPVIGKMLSGGLKAYRKDEYTTSLVYYLMAASAGVEVAHFNLAFLCDENNKEVVNYLEKDCRWRHYNQSIHRSGLYENTHAWIKMAEYHYYGLGGKQDIDLAADMYTNAALSDNPHALFSLAYLLEEGVLFKDNIWKRQHIPSEIYEDKSAILRHLYSRCREIKNGEAFIPCTVALYRVQVLQFWKNYNFALVALLVVLVTSLLVSSAFKVRNRILGRSGATV